jgi:rhodanese-related sulfurtransferase
MQLRALFFALAFALPLAARADTNPVVQETIEDYLQFTEYSSSLIWPEQIPAEDWKRLFLIDARDPAQFAQGHIPGAINIEWRQAVAHRNEIPRDRMVVVYCNSGSLSAQAVFALRLLGWDNVKVLQDGFEGWKAKGGFDANQRANKPAGH